MKKAVLLLTFFTFLVFFSLVGKAELSGWNYKDKIIVEPENDVIYDSNVSFRITLNTKNLISKGKMRSDCGDLRFTILLPNNIEKELDYYVENGTCNSANTNVWIKLPFLRNRTTLYMYYGNPSATSKSDPSVKVIYTDFKEGEPIPDIWYVSSNFVDSITGEYLISTSGSTQTLTLKQLFSGEIIMEWKGYTTHGTTWTLVWGTCNGAVDIDISGTDPGTPGSNFALVADQGCFNDYYINRGEDENVKDTAGHDHNEHVWRLELRKNGIFVYKDGSLYLSTGYIPKLKNNRVGFTLYGSPNNRFYIDWVKVWSYPFINYYIVQNVSECEFDIQPNTYVNITRDIDCNGKFFLRLDAYDYNSNLVIDLNNHTVSDFTWFLKIFGQGPSYTEGIVIKDGTLSTASANYILASENILLKNVYFNNLYIGGGTLFSFGGYPGDVWLSNVKLYSVTSSDTATIYGTRLYFRDTTLSNVRGTICYDEFYNSNVTGDIYVDPCDDYDIVYGNVYYDILNNLDSKTVETDNYIHVFYRGEDQSLYLRRYPKDMQTIYETKYFGKTVNPFDIKWFGEMDKLVVAWVDYYTNDVFVCFVSESNYTDSVCHTISGDYIDVSIGNIYNYELPVLTTFSASPIVISLTTYDTSAFPYNVIKSTTNLTIPSEYTTLYDTPQILWNGTHFKLLHIGERSDYAGLKYIYEHIYDSTLNHISSDCDSAWKCYTEFKRVIAYKDPDTDQFKMIAVYWDYPKVNQIYIDTFNREMTQISRDEVIVPFWLQYLYSVGSYTGSPILSILHKGFKYSITTAYIPPTYYCGNGVCEPGENVYNCPQDCPGYCGDGICNTYYENSTTCPEDCLPTCGNGVCEPGENVTNCPVDCPGYCGDGICNSYYENAQNCPQDCLPAYFVSNCFDIESPGYYIVSTTIEPGTKPYIPNQTMPYCIRIYSSNVVLDLQGYGIDCTFSAKNGGTTTAIGIAGSPDNKLKNIVIKNGFIKNCVWGIIDYYADNVTISNIRIDMEDWAYDYYNSIWAVTDGLYVEGVTFNRFEGIYVNNYDFGIYAPLIDPIKSVIYNSTFVSNVFDNIKEIGYNLFADTKQNVFYGCEVRNSKIGWHCESCKNNTVLKGSYNGEINGISVAGDARYNTFAYLDTNKITLYEGTRDNLVCSISGIYIDKGNNTFRIVCPELFNITALNVTVAPPVFLTPIFVPSGLEILEFLFTPYFYLTLGAVGVSGFLTYLTGNPLVFAGSMLVFIIAYTLMGAYPLWFSIILGLVILATAFLLYRIGVRR